VGKGGRRRQWAGAYSKGGLVLKKLAPNPPGTIPGGGTNEGVECPVGHHAEGDAFWDSLYSAGGEQGESGGGGGEVIEQEGDPLRNGGFDFRLVFFFELHEILENNRTFPTVKEATIDKNLLVIRRKRREPVRRKKLSPGFGGIRQVLKGPEIRRRNSSGGSLKFLQRLAGVFLPKVFLVAAVAGGVVGGGSRDFFEGESRAEGELFSDDFDLSMNLGEKGGKEDEFFHLESRG